MTSLTVSGLSSSGIDVSSIVSQLMAVEKQPQDALQTKKTAEIAKGTTWASITTQLTSLQAAVQAVQTPTAFNTSTVTSSDSSVLTATASGSASAGSVSLQVQSLAAAEQRASSGFASTTSTVGAGTLVIAGGATAAGISSLTANGIADGRHTLTVKNAPDSNGNATFTLDGNDYTVAVGNGPVDVGGLTLDGSSFKAGASVDVTVATADGTTTLAGLASELSNYGGPANAAAVDLGSGSDPARLILSAAQAGTANGLLISGTGDLGSLASGMSITKSASNAVVTMGSLTVTRTSNTFNDLLPGVSLNLLKATPGQEVTLTVGRDSSGSGNKVQALVDALNSSLDLLAKSSSYDQSSNTGQPLNGDSQVTMLQDQLSEMGSVFGSGATATMSQIGVNFTRDGRYTFDAAAFANQMAADPDGVTKLVNAAANTVAPVMDSALGTLTQTGWIKSTQDGISSSAATIQDQIDDWDVRLSDIQTRYQTQYAALDAAISSMNDQKSWLTSTIAGLAANS
jgi:flagellar hook-associated protein 2